MSGEVKVKICGITRPEDAVVAAEAGAWAIGLVFYPGSPRCVSAVQAQRIDRVLSQEVLRVGVFMDQTLEDIRGVEREVRLDLVQFQAAAADDFCRGLGTARCVQVVALEDQESVDRAVGSQADYVLIDRPRPGGTPKGGPVDWTLAGRVAQKRPRTILAGALTPANVAEAIRRASPWGVDVSGGVERAPGIKDAIKIRAFIEAARGVMS
jgi:phosphoribosylanthranilate isomerase